MITEPAAPLALIRWHQRFDSRPKLIRNHTHPRHQQIVAGQHLLIRETRPRQMIADGRLTGYRAGARLIRLDLNEVDAAMQPFGGAV
ncbi:putative dNA binding domain protein [Mycobacterium kansasii 732]|nr:putative dNA binding domain protein [Mycobacterium kansasii 732]